MRSRRLGACVLVALVGVVAAPVAGQSVRGWIGSTVQMVEVRPLSPAAACTAGSACYAPLREERSLAATQDVSLTGWGFGVRGLSATALIRGRARLGSDFPWPRSDDRFDAILAYAQLVRGSLTVRAGRQEIRTGLGFPSFDGATVAWYRGSGGVRLEGYGGRSLARGLRMPSNEAFRGIEDFVPDQGVLLFGGSARARLRNLSVTARYQREILSDRSALASERGALDLSLLTPTGRWSGSADYDVPMDRLGKADLTWSMPFAEGRWLTSVTALRYVPYFSLSTIWGFFEPVEYQGVEARVGWSPSARWGAWGTVGWRVYGDAQTAVVLEPLSDQGRRVQLGGRWAASGAFTVEGRYALEWGPGSFLQSGDTSVRWTPSERASLSASLLTFQQIEQYRLGDGRGVGGGATADLMVMDRLSFGAGVSLVRHTSAGGATSPWNQTRAWSHVRVLVGEDPGMANRRRR